MSSFQTVAGSGPEANRNPVDFYPTPAPVVRALLERETFPEVVWEPAAGRGHLARELRRYGYKTFASELHTQPGDVGTDAHLDFLSPGGPMGRSIVTNPPFRLAEKFIRKAVELRMEKHAWLLRVQFVESARRYSLFRDHPPRRIWAFSRRVQISERGLEEPLGGIIAFAWWVWERDFRGGTELGWIPPDAIKRGERTP